MLRKQAFRVLVLRNRLPYFKRGRTLVQFWKTRQIHEFIRMYTNFLRGRINAEVGLRALVAQVAAVNWPGSFSAKSKVL